MKQVMFMKKLVYLTLIFSSYMSWGQNYRDTLVLKEEDVFFEYCADSLEPIFKVKLEEFHSVYDKQENIEHWKVEQRHHQEFVQKNSQTKLDKIIKAIDHCLHHITVIDTGFDRHLETADNPFIFLISSHEVQLSQEAQEYWRTHLYALIAEHDELLIEIQSHGSQEEDSRCSAKRLESIKHLIHHEGLDMKHFTFKDFGANQPIVSEKSIHHSFNARITLKVSMVVK